MIFVSIIVVLCVDHPTEKRVQQHTMSLTTLTILSTPTKLTISTYQKNYQEEICRIRIVSFVLFVVFLCFILSQHGERSVYVHYTSKTSDFLYLILWSPSNTILRIETPPQHMCCVPDKTTHPRLCLGQGKPGEYR